MNGTNLRTALYLDELGDVEEELEVDVAKFCGSFELFLPPYRV